MQLVCVLLGLLLASVFSNGRLQSQTSYGKITFYSIPEPNYISGEFSPKSSSSTRLLFYSLVSDGNREVTLTDENHNVIINYVIAPHEIAFIKVGQLSFIGHQTADTILHLPTTEFPTDF